MEVLNLPNTLTFTRIVIIPVFIISIIYKKYDYALLLFIVAAITDIFDGLSARLTNQKTALGAFLDPLADKFLLVTTFIILSVYDLIPKWLAIIVISREIIVITGWLLLYLVSNISRVEPSMLGKITIWLQSIFIAYVLINININIFPDNPPILLFLTSGITILSAFHYIYRGLKFSHDN